MDDPFILVRTVHYAATVLVSGIVFFLIFVAEPAFCKAGGGGSLTAAVRHRLAWLAWSGLILSLISGAAWLIFVAARMIDAPLPEVLTDGAIWTVLTDTDFGRDWIARLVLSGLFLAASLPMFRTQGITSRLRRIWAALLASGLIGTLAFAGHAAAGTGVAGVVHLTADVLHLISAAAWMGALLPLALLLGKAACAHDDNARIVAREAVSRFSTFGIACVGMLVATGIVNAWMLVGNLRSFVSTDYGRLLVAKIVLFLVMLVIAGANRLILTPRLMRISASSGDSTLRQLRNNSLVEACLGMVIVIIVAALGILSPLIQE